MTRRIMMMMLLSVVGAGGLTSCGKDTSAEACRSRTVTVAHGSAVRADFDGDGRNDEAFAYESGTAWRMHIVASRSGSIDGELVGRGEQSIAATPRFDGARRSLAVVLEATGGNADLVRFYRVRGCALSLVSFRPAAPFSDGKAVNLGGSVSHGDGVACDLDTSTIRVVHQEIADTVVATEVSTSEYRLRGQVARRIRETKVVKEGDLDPTLQQLDC